MTHLASVPQEIFARRLEQFYASTSPLLAYYSAQAAGSAAATHLVTLAGSTSVQIYRQYVDAYGLVYSEGREASVTFPAHEGSLDLQHAQPLGGSASPR